MTCIKLIALQVKGPISYKQRVLKPADVISGFLLDRYYVIRLGDQY